MTRIEIENLLSAAFCGGEICRRELRLTEEAAGYIAVHYPARVTALGGAWYEITFRGGLPHGA